MTTYNPLVSAIAVMIAELTSDRACQYYEVCLEQAVGIGVWVLGNYAIAVYRMGQLVGSLCYPEVVIIQAEPLLLAGFEPQKKADRKTGPPNPTKWGKMEKPNRAQPRRQHRR